MLTSAAMDLAKPCIDVGFFTNRLDEMRTFYAERIGLPFEEILPVGGGVRQHRFGLLGSVLKINHARDPLPQRQPGGYSRLIIADRRLPMRMAMRDPDGNELELVPPGHFDIQQTEIHLSVRDEAALDRFYGEALGGEQIGPHRFRLGETIVSFEADPTLPPVQAQAPVSAAEAIASMRAVGFRYITIQVRDCDAEHRRLLAMGVREGSAPVTLGAVARISFVRDPDGNWIEISQRASLTGPIPR